VERGLYSLDGPGTEWSFTPARERILASEIEATPSAHWTTGTITSRPCLCSDFWTVFWINGGICCLFSHSFSLRFTMMI
jgi:hypothetical protein